MLYAYNGYDGAKSTDLTATFDVEGYTTLSVDSVTSNGSTSTGNNYFRVVDTATSEYIYDDVRPESPISIDISGATEIQIITKSYAAKAWVQINNLMIS